MAYVRKPISGSAESPELQRALSKIDEELRKLGLLLIDERTRYIYISDTLLDDSVGEDGDILLVY
jgi:hypothetical protein